MFGHFRYDLFSIDELNGFCLKCFVYSLLKCGFCKKSLVISVITFVLLVLIETLLCVCFYSLPMALNLFLLFLVHSNSIWKGKYIF